MIREVKHAAADISRRQILYWRETTDAQKFETGIQRVTRRLANGLTRQGVDPTPVGWDAVHRVLRVPEAVGSRWKADWLLLPEIPLSTLSEGLDPIQLSRAYGLRSAAIVHDLIPMRLAHLYDTASRALYRRYFRMFSDADLVFATTNLVAGHLRTHLEDEGLTVPPIIAVPLPGQFGDMPRVQMASDPRLPTEPLRLLTVATWEPRKNLAGLLRAVRLAQNDSSVPILLSLVGRRAGYGEHDVEIESLIKATPGVAVHHDLDDLSLAALYATHHASVYPSTEEGFGLPVLESLWLGRPCLCHAGSAMAEVACGGGTLKLNMNDENAVADVLKRLAGEAGLLERLTREAVECSLRTWDDYARDIVNALRNN
jgi:glycosyltransferase involved in cell wall biosynthesis